MTIKIVVKYARRKRSDEEVYRQAVLTCKLPKQGHYWHDAVMKAWAGLRPGERVISISEAGYQL